MRLLSLKLLQSEFLKEDSELLKKCYENKEKLNLSDAKFDNFISYCTDITLLHKNEKSSFKNQWKIFVQKFLSQITNIYSKSDEIFNCDNDVALEEITGIINELVVNDDFINSYGTNCGDIHEMFATYGGKASSKTLGAFYTPRKLIDLILGPLGVSKLIKESYDIYDPCMGTGGFLTRAHKKAKKEFNIHGCETALGYQIWLLFSPYPSRKNNEKFKNVILFVI